MSASARDRGKEAVEAVLEQFYKNIGTPAPAPGIERLAFFAVEAAYESLRAAWAQDLQSDAALAAFDRHLMENVYADDDMPVLEDYRRAMQAALAKIE